MATNNQNDLISRFQALEKKKADLEIQKNELVGRRATLVESKDKILKDLEPFGIKSIDELSTRISQLNSELSNQLSTIENKLNAVTTNG